MGEGWKINFKTLSKSFGNCAAIDPTGEGGREYSSSSRILSTGSVLNREHILYICTAKKQRMEGECTDKNMFVEISKYDFIEMFIYSIRVKGTRS